jgi:DNA-binding LytR/AlgR family response regulator
MTCIIIDDEKHAIDVLEHYVRQIPSLRLLASFTNPLDALPFLNTTIPDLLFLDIQMPEISGLELIKTLPPQIRIILTTAYSEFVTEGFELEVTDYLLKPVPFPRFLKAVQRAQQSLPSTSVKEQADDDADDYFFVKTELKGRMLKINFRDIDYIEGERNYVSIYHNGTRTMALLNMKDLEDRLPPRYFMRIHKSYIIAVEKIVAIEGNMVYLRGIKEQTILGNTYRAAFLERMKGKIMQ